MFGEKVGLCCDKDVKRDGTGSLTDCWECDWAGDARMLLLQAIMRASWFLLHVRVILLGSDVARGSEVTLNLERD